MFSQCSWLGAIVLFALMPNLANGLEDLKDRARWKSFGVENWADYDPLERGLPSRPPVKLGEWQVSQDAPAIAQLKSLIALAEAGTRQYNAVHVGAKRMPTKKPTELTLGEIKIWTRTTPNQPHAIGRYQFIPSTLRHLAKRAKMSDSTRFSAQTQDRLADLLLSDAGIERFTNGKLSRVQFMDNLALIWAGLPTRSGKSAYHGYAGNRATITRPFFDKEIRRIFRR